MIPWDVTRPKLFPRKGVRQRIPGQTVVRNRRAQMVRTRGLEPLTLAGPDPKSGASAIPPRAQSEQHARLEPLINWKPLIDADLR